MPNKAILRSYKMTSDRGFAPNPYAGVLTLATCKPYIRKSCAIKGQWLAGFTSKALLPDEGDNVKLIYLAKISDMVPMERYWDTYPAKRNCASADNIYRRGQDGKWTIVNCDIHNQGNMDADTVGENVIIANEYFYFGIKALRISKALSSKIRIPQGTAPYGWLSKGKDAEVFIGWVKGEAERMQPMKNHPHMFGEPHGPVALRNSAPCSFRPCRSIQQTC
ncbi:MAG: hypothetical protein LUC93_18585 [Planctomycetaceae bacterium]|nr:hypothetical protein [Planctomycetaceae bacterium]